MRPSDDPRLVRRAQRLEYGRSLPLGVLLPMETTLFVAIALRHFDAPGLVKGLVAAAAGVGLMATPFVTAWARQWQRPVMVPVGVLCAVGAAGLLLASVGPLATFVIGSIIGIASINALYTLVTVTYERNLPPTEIGRRVGRAMSLKVLVQAGAGLAMGWFLTVRLDLWWCVPLLGAFMLALLVVLHVRIPSDPLPPVPGVRNRPWPHFHLLRDDRRLRLTLIAWMLMGFGNLMLLPLRIEYLGNPRYGIDASTTLIAVLTVVIPSIVRLSTMPMFGWVFDRLSFFSSRILVNFLFALYVAAFFTGTSMTGLVIGAMLLGVGSAGGDLTWNLWVTKFAPAGRVADYMGLHTFFTGTRAIAAPIIGFAIIDSTPLSTVALMAAGLMVAASFVLVPEMRVERRARAEAAAVTAP